MLRKIELGKFGKLKEIRVPEISINPVSLILLLNAWIFLYLGLQIMKIHGIASFYAERIAVISPSLLSYLDLAEFLAPMLVIYAMLQIAAAVAEVMRR